MSWSGPADLDASFRNCNSLFDLLYHTAVTNFSVPYNELSLQNLIGFIEKLMNGD